MELSAIKGVVQNTTLYNQIDTIVNSLDKIMLVLIIIAVLLVVVILYNLTNINVAERIRELYYILTVVPPDEVMFDPKLWIGAFIIPFVTITVVTFVLKFYVNNKLKNVDMLEALKSVD